MSNVITAKQWLLINKPTYKQEVNLDYDSKDATFKLVEVKYDLDDSNLLQKGEILIENLYLSNDPAQKGWFSPFKSYVDPTPPNTPAPARGIAKVVKSNSEKYKEGDYIQARVDWGTYNIIEDTRPGTLKIDPSKFDTLSKYLSVFGSTTLTAYLAAFKYSELNKVEGNEGKTYLVTGAAGAVGSVAVQLLAKVFKAKKVLAVAGGDEKVKYVESLGKDGNVIGLDYRSKTYKEDFAKALGDDEIDVFIDNVGGDLLDHAVGRVKVHGNIVQVGTIAGYNDETKMYFKNYSAVVTRRLTIKGFIVSDDIADFPKIIQHLSQLAQSGSLDLSQIRQTVVDGSGENFKKVPELWTGLFKGQNTGKYITRVTTNAKL